jgi:hypothetical protein
MCPVHKNRTFITLSVVCRSVDIGTKMDVFNYSKGFSFVTKYVSILWVFKIYGNYTFSNWILFKRRNFAIELTVPVHQGLMLMKFLIKTNTNIKSLDIK